jgi:hypothetical protein
VLLADLPVNNTGKHEALRTSMYRAEATEASFAHFLHDHPGLGALFEQVW